MGLTALARVLLVELPAAGLVGPLCRAVLALVGRYDQGNQQ